MANSSNTDETKTNLSPDDSDHDTGERMSRPQRQVAERGQHAVSKELDQAT